LAFVRRREGAGEACSESSASASSEAREGDAAGKASDERESPTASVSKAESVPNVEPSPNVEALANDVALSYVPPMSRDVSNVVVATSSLKMLETPPVVGIPSASTSARARLRLVRMGCLFSDGEAAETTAD
jgi:hypothetical protein